MATNSTRLHALRLAVVLAALCALSCAWSAEASARYGWPVRPFDRQHPVRGFFGDPRIEGRVRQFHFGVDVSAFPRLLKAEAAAKAMPAFADAAPDRQPDAE